MPEILTESFCERCGTRYTFESAAPKAKRLGKFKTLSKGLRNFVLDDDTSLDEALAAARSEEDREATAQQLDAFHKAFNFCMSCRQYTCANCWNEPDGRCLTCAPHLGHDILQAPFPQLDLNGVRGGLTGSPDLGDGPRPDGLAWPTIDRPAAEAEREPQLSSDAWRTIFWPGSGPARASTPRSTHTRPRWRRARRPSMPMPS